MTRAFIGLGSNVGDRLDHLRRAVELLRSSMEIVEVSSVYETEAVGPPQDDFLNGVVSIETDLPAEDLLSLLKRIEAEVGRNPSERWGPREIDLDLLLFGDESVERDDLRVPHPQMASRRFVLEPLLEIAPRAQLPGGSTVADLACAASSQRVERFAGPESLLF